MSTAEAAGNRSSRRRQAISDLVQAHGSVRIEDLTEQFGVSAMTIHRDLDQLHDRGVLRKVRSGAEARPSQAFEHDKRYREGLNTLEKSAIAAAALEWLDQRITVQAVALDESTTNLHLLPLLKPRYPLTVVTNFLPVITALAGEQQARLVALGGEYDRPFDCFGGPAVVRSLTELHVDAVFISAPSITRGACYHPLRETADLKLTFMRCAEVRVLLADHTKLRRRAVHRIAPLSDFDVVVTDDGADAEELEALRHSGVEVVVASTAAARGGEDAPVGPR